MASLVGNLMAGLTMDLCAAEGEIAYRAFWTVPFVISLGAMAMLRKAFRERDRAEA